MEETKVWKITPEEDPETGDMILIFPPDLLELAKWQPGDILIWSVQDDGSVYLTKKEEIDKNL
jgi:hypothetical protein